MRISLNNTTQKIYWKTKQKIQKYKNTKGATSDKALLLFIALGKN
jgi:hypothetical protein